MQNPKPSQYSGCLIGQTLGDALGFPVEGFPRVICQEYVQDVLQAGRAGMQGREPFSFGQYTDDSQLARELIQSYVSKKGFQARDFADRIAAIFREDRIVGRGRTTEQAALRLQEGVSWDHAGTPPPAAGNGSAMRAAPVGLFCYDDPKALINTAQDQGRITHQDSRCCAGSVAIAGATALALRHETIEPYSFLEQLGEWVDEMDEAFAMFIQQMSEWVEMPPKEAGMLIKRAGSGQQADEFDGVTPFVVSSVLWSLYSFLRHPDSYWDTVCLAISIGGDVDTTAAMAGAISGAHLGIEAMPLELARKLNDQGTWGYEELIKLAEDCYRVKMQGA